MNNNAGRPTKSQQAAIKIRDRTVYKMSKKYPNSYLEVHFNLDKSTISKIIKAQKELESTK